MQLPLMSGMEATRVLRNQGYVGAIMALTVNAPSEDRNAYLQAGYNGYLTRPVNCDRLYSVTAQFRKLVNEPRGYGSNFVYPTLSALSERILIELKQNNLRVVSGLFAEPTHQTKRIYRGVFPQSSSQGLHAVK